MPGGSIINTRREALSLAEIARNHKALNLRILQVSGHCDYADYFLIMSGTSSTHVRSLADAFLKAYGKPTSAAEGYAAGEWVLVDLGDFIIHVFLDSVRSVYQLDKLWSDAPTVSMEGESSSEDKNLSYSSSA